MVRISVGIEDVEVLLQDLEDALKAIEWLYYFQNINYRGYRMFDFYRKLKE